MAKMRVAQVPKAGADFEIAEREIPQPGTGEVNEAYARMMSGKAEFRVVLTMEARHGHHAPRRWRRWQGNSGHRSGPPRPGPAPMRDFSRPLHAVLTCPREPPAWPRPCRAPP